MDNTPPEHRANQLKAAEQPLSALDVISNLLTISGFDLDRLLDEIVRISAQSLQVKACTIRLLDEQTGEMVLKAGYGLSQQYLSKGPVIASQSVFRQMIERCSQEEDGVIEIFDVSSDPRVQYAREAVQEGIHSLMAVPLLHNKRIIGALTAFTAHPHRFSTAGVSILQTIANQSSVAIYLARLYQKQLALERMERELAIAATIQAKLMPDRTPQLNGFDIAGFNRPCKEVSGDFYDYIHFPNDNLGVAVGDVAGKGMPAALLMASVRTALRVQAENLYTMREIISRVDRALYQDTRSVEFSTLFYGVISVEAQALTYVNAGHESPLLLRGDEVQPLEAGGLPVGLMPGLTYHEEILMLAPSDVLAIFTDGYPEVPDRAGELFGEERVMASLRAFRHLPASQIIQHLEAEVAAFMDPEADFCDDRTIVVIKVEGGKFAA